MIKPEMVPLEVWLALRDYVRERPYGYDYTEAIASALSAWPGMYRADWNDKNELDPVIILPLPQETRDDQ